MIFDHGDDDDDLVNSLFLNRSAWTVDILSLLTTTFLFE